MSRPEIIIAVNNTAFGDKIRQVLTGSGYGVLEICTSGSDAIRKVRTLKPDLLMANYELSDTTGFEVARIAAGNKLCSVILLTNDTQKGYVEHKAGDLDIVCLNKPINKLLLLNTIELVMKSRQRILRLEAELYEMKSNLDVRRLVDRAKKLLMEKSGLSEQEAHRKIQKQSMDTGVPIKEVAKSIIDRME